MNYDLEQRTKDFSKAVIRYCKTIKINPLNSNILAQVLRSSTSVGANYKEANGASSKNDFRNKIHLCRKEIQETEYWLELLEEIDTVNKKELGLISKEAHELCLIFNKISSSLKT
jgi:four helix bundle protein